MKFKNWYQIEKKDCLYDRLSDYKKCNGQIILIRNELK